MDDEVKRLKASLLRRLRIAPKNGDEAAERHILLAVRFHHAAILNQTVTGEGKGWVEFFKDHFPKRSSVRLPDDADRLWLNWRLGLVKGEGPLSGVTMTHGQPEAHWHREPDEALCIDLESMWDDFEASVESFAALLRRNDQRRERAVARWRNSEWAVRRLKVPAGRDDLQHVAVSTAMSSVLTTTPNRPAGRDAPPPETR
jgi:hypothetical protein